MPRILLAGMNKYPNQFSRQLARMGCQTVPLSGDPGGHIPTDCEAVIITKCQSSHEKFWQVKDAYKALNKPVFITDFGFSPIKERFVEFLKKLPPPTQNEKAAAKLKMAFNQLALELGRTSLNNNTEISKGPTEYSEQIQTGMMNVNSKPSQKEAPKVATTEYPLRSTGKKKKTGPKPGTSRVVHPKTVTDRVNQIIIECYEADMSTRETLDMIKAEGFKMADGREYTTAYISTIRYRLGLRPKADTSTKPPRRASATLAKVAPKPSTPEKPAEAPKAPTALELIGKVLKSKLPQDQKLQLVAKIQAGQIAAEQAVVARKTSTGSIALISTSIYDPEEKPLLTLNKVQAVAVIQALTDIEEFIKEP